MIKFRSQYEIDVQYFHVVNKISRNNIYVCKKETVLSHQFITAQCSKDVQ